MKIVCKCGNKFNTFPSRLKIGSGKYCSKKCSSTQFQRGFTPWNKGIKGIFHSHFKGKKRPEFSGMLHPMFGRHHSPESILKMSKSHTGRVMSIEEKKRISLFFKGKHLSKETKKKISIANKGKPGSKGKNSPNWKGGITSANKLERNKFVVTMQKLVFERDNYTCQLCNIRGGYLQVDHIQPWAEYVELRFSMDNCRTLCMSCHYKITFGKPMPKTVKNWGHNLNKNITTNLN